MRTWILAAALLAVAAWGYLQTRKLSDGDVQAFYQAETQAVGTHDADAACALLADEMRADVQGTAAGQALSERGISKPAFCERQKTLFARIDRLEKAAGGSVTDYHTQFGPPTYSADHRSATVQLRYEYSLMGGNLMRVKGIREDTLVKRKGKVLLVATVDRANATFGPQ